MLLFAFHSEKCKTIVQRATSNKVSEDYSYLTFVVGFILNFKKLKNDIGLSVNKKVIKLDSALSKHS